MKKSLLNIAVSIAMSGTLLTASTLATQAYADDLAALSPESSADVSNETTQNTYMYPGMGVGAATGAVVAGPVGLLIGGLIGAVVGNKQDRSEAPASSEEAVTIAASSARQDNIDGDAAASVIDTVNTSDNTPVIVAEHSAVSTGIQLAQAGTLTPVITDTVNIEQDGLINSLTTDLGLDVYFRSGSADIESFYPARLAAIAGLLNTMNSMGKEQLELHLDGYTDRRGDKDQNIALANERIENVRQQLIAAGVAENRINSMAFGEMKMVSSAGDLEGYTFDRKVVIRFERVTADSDRSMAAILSTQQEDNRHAEDAAGHSPIIAEASSRF